MRFLPFLSLLALTACGAAERLDHLGKPPSMSPVGEVVAPHREHSLARPIREAMEADRAGAGAPSASLYRPGASTLFSDQRATRVGDIVTVRIDISDRAELASTTSRSRGAGESAGLPKLFGLETLVPAATDPAKLVDANSSSTSNGAGQTQRRERIDMTVAAIVTEVLPNGNLVIRGRQEVRVNYELREFGIVGIVRPQDITPANSIDQSQIAEARIVYGGRGHLMDTQQARWGQQIWDAIFPF